VCRLGGEPGWQLHKAGGAPCFSRATFIAAALLSNCTFSIIALPQDSPLQKSEGLRLQMKRIHNHER